MSSERSNGASIEQLYRELTAVNPQTRAEGTSQHRSEEIVVDAMDELFPGVSFEFDEELIKNSLDELLVMLVALREGETHGKGLMEDLSTLFDAQLSPGTVYPRLHELEHESVLEMHELVRTKEYRIDDVEAARHRIEAAMSQHLALGFVFYSALGELDTEQQ